MTISSAERLNTVTMINPAYSDSNSSINDHAFYQNDSVEINMAPSPPTPKREMRNIPRLLYLIFVGVLAVSALMYTVLGGSCPSSTEDPPFEVLESLFIDSIAAELENATIPHWITTTMTTDIETTTVENVQETTTTTPIPTTRPFNLTRAHYDLLYEVFLETTNGTRTGDGLQNFIENYPYFNWKDQDALYALTQFAAVSLKDLSHLVAVSRDMVMYARRECTLSVRGSEDYWNQRDLYNTMLFPYYAVGERVPQRVNMSDKIIPRVKNQGTWCDGGYAMAAITLAEVFSGTTEELSTQALICDEHTHGCEGGTAYHALQSIYDKGLWSNSNWRFDPYDQDCKQNKNKSDWTVVNAPCRFSGEMNAKKFVGKLGPVIVEIPVHRQFFFYKSGIYNMNCSDTIIGYQPVVITGYGRKDDVDFWELRNSWGKDWGVKGTFRIQRGLNICGLFDYVVSFL